MFPQLPDHARETSRKAQINRVVPVHHDGYPVTYFESAPHPPSERRTDAGQLPPWLPGVVFSSAPLSPAAARVCRATYGVLSAPLSWRPGGAASGPRPAARSGDPLRESAR
ncbi:hypothetical protein Sdia_25130 [Streptomyces diastaticus subsp. diastaticus]|uniref:Uncharacterized protein n=1 Tax=Streptomyces diastaticus subsp. diastaticus TaxID=68040 RepID=A0ABQ1CN85_STRDI|nr:hypothetical protein Srut_29690 [Streptomyces rutgersensis]GFH71745.1 hypothetical protein Sdia_25130 [Streptomyces diastaticus subsp. diastaticus]GGU14357.1 hypothetical protein GCM10015534_16670 [Streptomyces diastaticus subsp. diastaticus]